ncbi:MAG: F0F1 ATP synthase subunit gamma, partial [Paracoccaceae bacterium]|nr:F0F1 ATP synthase subunit gamma [Paracoccaceae bacterium]
PDAVAPTVKPPDGARLFIVVGASQGFSGAYSERLVAAALTQTQGSRDTFMLIGQRCITEFAAHGIQPIWSAEMVSHCAEVPALASRINDALFAQLGAGKVDRVTLLSADPGPPVVTIVNQTLMPFDFTQIATRATAAAPLTTLPPQDLSLGLVEEYVFSTVCKSLMLGFAAENDARMEAMSRARRNVRRIREDLRSEFARARQEQTTTEIVELSGAATQIKP